MNLTQARGSIAPVDEQARAAAQARFDHKTKPLGSLGRLEDLACRVAAVRGTARPAVGKKSIVIMAADHGVAREGVSAYPQEVTGQMLANFCRGGAAINVLARQAGAELLLVDMGTIGARTLQSAQPGVRTLSASFGQGTRSFVDGCAMTFETAVQAIETGICLASDLAGNGVELIGLGEMGIGNTTSASALTAVFTDSPVARVTGSGTGLDSARVLHKITVIERALSFHRPNPQDPVRVLAQIGGFEIAGLVGLTLGAAAKRIPVVVDGLISSVAALAAIRMAPDTAAYVITSHRSVEPGHDAVLREIGVEPLLDLQMRLGEGTGAMLAMGLVEAAVRLLAEMASFDEARVATAVQ